MCTSGRIQQLIPTGMEDGGEEGGAGDLADTVLICALLVLRKKELQKKELKRNVVLQITFGNQLLEKALEFRGTGSVRCAPKNLVSNKSCAMTTVSSDSSSDYEKHQKELSQTYGGSVSDYSEDTWESFSEEEVASCQHESKSSELYCSTEDTEHSAVLEPLGSMLWLSDQSHAEEQSGVLDSAAVEKDFIGKLIDVLKNKEAGIKQEKFIIRTCAEVTELSEEELDALQSFCLLKIRRMLKQRIPMQASGGTSRKQQCGFTSKASEASDSNGIVPDRLMNRIRLKNIQETLNQPSCWDRHCSLHQSLILQVAEAQVHRSSLCPDCKKMKAELAEIAFLRQKKIQMESALLQEIMEEQIYSRGRNHCAAAIVMHELHSAIEFLAIDVGSHPRIADMICGL
ncbi:hypothetical protein ASZ78_016849 [Callipepla squamata]|uniref:Uncharacterized protein n=1 Tax=Callipepla squamata TaxID=9009 RepID=A0A226MTP7_CALSU|nr:hypothetical protein ASZ78_016849 [Callipepla squamata]